MLCIRISMYIMYRRILYINAFFVKQVCINAGLGIQPSLHSSNLSFTHLSNISLRLCMFLKNPPIHPFTSCFFLPWCNSPSWPRPPHYRGFITLTLHSVGLLWTSDQPDAEASTWQHTTLTRDRNTCPRRDSNPQSQKASGRRPTP